MIITIDGPAASGKSTLARSLAQVLGCFYLNSGLLYRAVAYILINNCAYTLEDLSNPDPIQLQLYIDPKRLVYDYDKDFKERIFFDGQDITPFLKTSFIDKGASIVSTNEKVRDLLLDVMRVVPQKFKVVAEGRDTGTVVFPEANIKIYLTAPVAVRAKRWQEEQHKKGIVFTLKEAIEALTERDKRDSERKVAPLVIPDDAIIVDNYDMDADQTLAHVVSLLKNNKMIEAQK